MILSSSCSTRRRAASRSAPALSRAATAASRSARCRRTCRPSLSITSAYPSSMAATAQVTARSDRGIALDQPRRAHDRGHLMQLMQRQRLRGRRQPRMALPEHQSGHVRGPGHNHLPRQDRRPGNIAYRYPRRAAIAGRRPRQVRKRPVRQPHRQKGTHRPATGFWLVILHAETLRAGIHVHRDHGPLKGERLSRAVHGRLIAAGRRRLITPHHLIHGDG